MSKPELKKRVTFKLFAPDASEVFLAGSFNGWDSGMRLLKQDKAGWWKTWMNLGRGLHEYKFVVDGTWQEDPANIERSVNDFGSFNSIIRVK